MVENYLKCDFLHVFAISTTGSIGRPDYDQFLQVSFKICLISSTFHVEGTPMPRKYLIPLKFQYLQNG